MKLDVKKNGERLRPLVPNQGEPSQSAVLPRCRIPIGGRPAYAPTRVRTEEDQTGDSFGMPGRVRDGDGSALRNAKQREAFETEIVDDGLQILNPRLEREVVDVAIRQSTASLVVAHQCVPASNPTNQDARPGSASRSRDGRSSALHARAADRYRRSCTRGADDPASCRSGSPGAAPRVPTTVLSGHRGTPRREHGTGSHGREWFARSAHPARCHRPLDGAA